jgi:hypothetical protein
MLHLPPISTPKTTLSTFDWMKAELHVRPQGQARWARRIQMSVIRSYLFPRLPQFRIPQTPQISFLHKALVSLVQILVHIFILSPGLHLVRNKLL